MDVTDYLRVLRRRWLLVVLPVVIGLVAAWFTMPQSAPTTPVGRSYDATATIVYDLSATSGFGSGNALNRLSLSTVALFAQTGTIPDLAAKAIGFTGSSAVLASEVSISADRTTNSLQIKGSDANADEVTKRVNAFARATVDYFHQRQVSQAQKSLDSVNSQLADVSERLQSAQRALNANSKDAVAIGQTRALQPQYANLLRQSNDLQTSVSATGPLSLLQRAEPVPVDTGGITAPRSSYGRLGVAAVLALLIGIALALVVDRFDTRLHTRRQTEDAFDLPVVTEVPPVPRRRRKPTVATHEDPDGRLADAYRELRSAVMVLGREPAEVGSPGRLEAEPVVVLVCSARRREGRTTVVANLAGAMAEAGHRVIVLSTDLRNPALEQFFGVENGAGVSELMSRPDETDFLSLVRETNAPGVEMVTAGDTDQHPRALLVSAERLIGEARRYADVVLLDSPASIEASDARDLAQLADHVLVVSRLHRTTTGIADALRIQMQRLRVPALGVVLVGSRPGTGSAGLRDQRLPEVTAGGWASEGTPRPSASMPPAPAAGMPPRPPHVGPAARPGLEPSAGVHATRTRAREVR